MLRRHILALVCGTVLVVLTAPVCAQDVDLERFQELVDAGVAHFQNEQWDEAIEKFREARTIYDEPTLVYNIGRAMQMANRCSAARAQFVEYLARGDLKDADRRRAAERVRELESCVENGRLILACKPQGASVRVDGRKTHVCPVELELEPGAHRLVIMAEGYEKRVETVEIASEEQTEVAIALVAHSEREPAGEAASWQRTAPWVLIGTGAGALAAGFAFDVSAVSRRRRIEEVAADASLSTQQKRARLERLRAAGQRTRTASIVGYVGGAVLLGSGLAWRYLVPASDASLALAATPQSVHAIFQW